jgi:hypothetical protein
VMILILYIRSAVYSRILILMYSVHKESKKSTLYVVFVLLVLEVGWLVTKTHNSTAVRTE